MKKAVRGLVTAVLAAAMLAGCGSTTEPVTAPDGLEQVNGAEGMAPETPDSQTGTEAKTPDTAANDSEISVISREDGSGTRGAFIELFGVEVKDENGIGLFLLVL